MGKPVIVVHGVANRDKSGFEALVSQFNRSINPELEFLPVYWGDLAADETGVRNALPKLGPDLLVANQGIKDSDNHNAMGTSSIFQCEFHEQGRHCDYAIKSIMAGAVAQMQSGRSTISPDNSSITRVSNSMSRQVELSPTSTLLRDVLEQEIPKTQNLQYLQNEEVLALLGETLGEIAGALTLTDGASNQDLGTVDSSTQSGETKSAISPTPIKDQDTNSVPVQERIIVRNPENSPVERVSNFREVVEGTVVVGLRTFESVTRNVIVGLDAMVGRVVNVSGGIFNNLLRTAVLPSTARFLGDIFVYQRNSEKIQRRLWEAIWRYEERTKTSKWGTEEKPIDVIAHSLGGLVTFDAAASGDLWMKRYITFGSQPALFHLADPRHQLQNFGKSGIKVKLPANFGTWTNFWEPMDMLAFLVGPIFMHSDGNSSPRDIKVRVPQGSELDRTLFWTHSSYWGLQAVIDDIRTILV